MTHKKGAEIGACLGRRRPLQSAMLTTIHALAFGGKVKGEGKPEDQRARLGTLLREATKRKSYLSLVNVDGIISSGWAHEPTIPLLSCLVCHRCLVCLIIGLINTYTRAENIRDLPFYDVGMNE